MRVVALDAPLALFEILLLRLLNILALLLSIAPCSSCAIPAPAGRFSGIGYAVTGFVPESHTADGCQREVRRPRACSVRRSDARRTERRGRLSSAAVKRFEKDQNLPTLAASTGGPEAPRRTEKEGPRPLSSSSRCGRCVCGCLSARRRVCSSTGLGWGATPHMTTPKRCASGTDVDLEARIDQLEAIIRAGVADLGPHIPSAQRRRGSASFTTTSWPTRYAYIPISRRYRHPPLSLSLAAATIASPTSRPTPTCNDAVRQQSAAVVPPRLEPAVSDEERKAMTQKFTHGARRVGFSPRDGPRCAFVWNKMEVHDTPAPAPAPAPAPTPAHPHPHTPTHPPLKWSAETLGPERMAQIEAYDVENFMGAGR